MNSEVFHALAYLLQGCSHEHALEILEAALSRLTTTQILPWGGAAARASCRFRLASNEPWQRVLMQGKGKLMGNAAKRSSSRGCEHRAAK